MGQPEIDRAIDYIKTFPSQIRHEESQTSEVELTLTPDQLPPSIVSAYPDILDNPPHMTTT